jgi:hypothetical protein
MTKNNSNSNSGSDGGGIILIIFLLLVLVGLGGFAYWYYVYRCHAKDWTTINLVAVDTTLKVSNVNVSVCTAQANARDGGYPAFFLTANSSGKYDAYFYPTTQKIISLPAKGTANLYYLSNTITISNPSSSGSSAAAGGGVTVPAGYTFTNGMEVTPYLNDLWSGQIATPQECANECNGHPLCKSFVIYPSEGKCHLKSVSSPFTTNAGATIYTRNSAGTIPTGYTFTDGIDITPGSNELLSVQTETPQDCANACNANPSCKSFVIHPWDNVCHLKSVSSPSVTAGDATTYIRNSAVSADASGSVSSSATPQ